MKSAEWIEKCVGESWLYRVLYCGSMLLISRKTLHAIWSYVDGNGTRGFSPMQTPPLCMEAAMNVTMFALEPRFIHTVWII